MLSTPTLLAGILAVGQLAGAARSSRSEGRSSGKRAATKDCIFTIRTMADIPLSKTSGCLTVNIESLTASDKTIVDFKNMKENTVINLKGDLDLCGRAHWADGPCMQVSGKNLTFNGNGHELYGNGEAYWDTWGGNGGVPKPKFISVTMSGVFQDVRVRNTPRHTFSIGNTLPLVIQRVHIDNSDGNKLIPGPEGDLLAQGHNSDCFDVSAYGTIIQDSTCDNQDDCLAVNKGSDIQFLRNKCNGGHGVSIGSIKSDQNVSNVLIQGNTITKSTNGLRIKTVSEATDASVSRITYMDNHASGITEIGVVIRQDYLNGGPTGIPTDSVSITDITFAGAMNTVDVVDGAQQVLVLCGKGTCRGVWDWGSLKTSGGTVPSSITPEEEVPIVGYSI